MKKAETALSKMSVQVPKDEIVMGVNLHLNFDGSLTVYIMRSHEDGGDIKIDCPRDMWKYKSEEWDKETDRMTGWNLIVNPEMLIGQWSGETE